MFKSNRIKAYRLMTGTYFTIACLLCSSFSIAQTSLHAGQSEVGTVVYLNGKIPSGHRFRLVRHSSNGDTLTIGYLVPVTSVKEYRKNESRMPENFRGLLALPDSTVKTLLAKLKPNNSFSDFPLGKASCVRFALGYGYHDKSADSTNTAFYSLYNDNTLLAKSNSVEYANQKKPPFIYAYRGTANEMNPKLIWYSRESLSDSILSFSVFRTKPFTLPYEHISTFTGFSFSGDTLFFMSRDTTLTNAGAYHYIIRLIDNFGRLSVPSEYIDAAYSPNPAYPLFIRISADGVDDHPQILLHWKLLGEELARSIDIYRSMNFDGPFSKIATVTPADTMYLDQIGQLKESYFYYLSAIPVLKSDTNVSVIVTDVSTYKEHAYPPIDFNAVADSSGVQLSWSPFKGNEIGFYVWRNTGYKQPMEKISGLIRRDSLVRISFTDTTGSIKGDRSYGYAISSIGQGFSESRLSDTLFVRPLNLVNLPAPEQTWLLKTDDGRWRFIWSDMQKQFPTLLGYRLKETLPGNKTKTLPVDSLIDPQRNYFLLSNLAPGTKISVQMLDVFGHSSPWSNQQIIPESDTNLNFGPRHIQCRNAENGVFIKWFTTDSMVTKYTLSRIDNSGINQTFEIPPSDDKSFTDTTAKKGMRYGYFLVSQSADGLKSNPTELVVIQTN